ncbi:MAG: hypothetical protein DMG58_28550 [Acidobacteria bacterium]|nr:MAG: hypothetical protein DMG58_28550 [Acidobacteriota bacterium]
MDVLVRIGLMAVFATNSIAITATETVGASEFSARADCSDDGLNQLPDQLGQNLNAVVSKNSTALKTQVFALLV